MEHYGREISAWLPELKGLSRQCAWHWHGMGGVGVVEIQHGTRMKQASSSPVSSKTLFIAFCSSKLSCQRFVDPLMMA